jgi:hypothetical protein
MGPRNAYKDMLDKVFSPIACVNMNHQNQLEQMANGAMFATHSSQLAKCIYECSIVSCIETQPMLPHLVKYMHCQISQTTFSICTEYYVEDVMVR